MTPLPFWAFETRVTRLGELLPIGRFITFGSFFKTNYQLATFWTTFSSE
jgi:hypothetical protein